MRNRVRLLLGTILLASTAVVGATNSVEFSFSNRSTNVLYVKVAGLPATASPGVLAPSSHGWERATSAYSGAVRVKDEIKLEWSEAAKKHLIELKRKDLGLPENISRTAVHFTYLGEGRWKIKVVRERQPDKVVEISSAESGESKE